jgi:hypothetical protein
LGTQVPPRRSRRFGFSRKALFVFQLEAQAESFVERADAHEFPFVCPLSKNEVSLRVKLHVPSGERTHAKTIGALRNQILIKRSGLDLGSNGGRGDVFVRDGERGVKLFNVCEIMQDGKHKIDPNFVELQNLGLDQDAVKKIIAAVYAEVDKPFRA